MTLRQGVLGHSWCILLGVVIKRLSEMIAFMDWYECALKNMARHQSQVDVDFPFFLLFFCSVFHPLGDTTRPTPAPPLSQSGSKSLSVAASSDLLSAPGAIRGMLVFFLPPAPPY